MQQISKKGKKKIKSYLINYQYLLGKGSSGTVYMAQNMLNHQIYAVKIIQKKNINQDQYMQKAFQQQLNIHKSLNSPNIVEFIDVIETTNNYYIVQEYCRGGTLRQAIQHKGLWKEKQALKALKCICMAFVQLLSKGVLHRDLKPENILLQQDNLKIADFGFAKKLVNQKQMTSTTIGTPLYMAPQLLQGQKYSSKCDIWSVGIIYYELLFGKQPWNGFNIENLLTNIKQNKLFFPSNINISQLSINLLSKILQFEQNQRLSWLQFFEHPLFIENNIYCSSSSSSSSNYQLISLCKIASNWRWRYKIVAEKLDYLASKVKIQQLLGVFLQLKTSYLSFQQFCQIMKWLIPDSENLQMSIMYEFFDKDRNGVIDLEQFIGIFEVCQPSVIRLLHNLLQNKHYYEQLSNYERLKELCKYQNVDQEIIQYTYTLIKNIKLEQK